MPPTAAPACKAALAEATRLWPARRRTSDGILSSDAHKKQNPNSGHDLGNAFDLSHDPEHGCDAHYLADRSMRARDERLLYVISKRRIWSRARWAEGWRPYTGKNPHETHAHFELDPSHRLSTWPWWPPSQAPAPPGRVMVRNYLASLVAPNGGVWHLAADGGIVTDTDGAGGPMAPFYGSVPGAGGAGDTRVRGILPHGQGYKVVVQHPDETISYFHFPAT